MAEAPVTNFHNKLAAAAVAMLVLGGVAIGAFATQAGGDMYDLVKVGFFGWIFWMWVTLGMLGLTLLHHTVRGKWGAPLVRIWEAGSNPITLALFGAVFVGIFLVGGQHIWEWLAPGATEHDAIIAGKAAYLNQTAMLIRWVIYIAFFIFLTWRLSSWLRLEEKTGDKKYSDKRNNFAAPMIVLFVLAINFAMTDVGMSLDPHWFSTIYGVWQMIGMVLAGLSFSAAIIGSQAKKEPYRQVVDSVLTKDIGNLLLAFSMVWAYFTLSQYLVIYSGNLPEFNVWFTARTQSGWSNVGAFAVIGQFFIPFLALCAPRTKRVPAIFALVAMWIFAIRFVDLSYTFLPSIQRGIKPTDVMWLAGCLGAILVFGAVWLILFVMHVKKKPLLTESHPYLAHKSHDHNEEAAHVA